MLHHLREHELAQVHPYLPRAARPQDGPVPRRRRGSNRQLDGGSLSKRFSTTYHDRSAQRWDTTALASLFNGSSVCSQFCESGVARSHGATSYTVNRLFPHSTVS